MSGNPVKGLPGRCDVRTCFLMLWLKIENDLILC